MALGREDGTERKTSGFGLHDTFVVSCFCFSGHTLLPHHWVPALWAREAVAGQSYHYQFGIPLGTQTQTGNRGKTWQ